MRSASRDKVDADEALALLEGVTGGRPDDEEILSLILGRSGTLRAPALRRGSTFVVGYNADLLDEALL